MKIKQIGLNKYKKTKIKTHIKWCKNPKFNC